MTTFTLTITMNDSTMRSGDDLAGALIDAASTLANRYDGLTLPDHLEGNFADATGRKAGEWTIAPEQPGPEDDGTIHAAVIRALHNRAGQAEDDDERGAITAGAQWIEDEPDEFWDEFAGPMLDDIERRFA